MSKEKEMLSAHLSVKEFEFSATALRAEVSNKMIPEHKENAKALALNIFEPLREHRGVPIKVTSGYRSLTLNKIVGGSTSSQHMKGEAMDLPITNNEALWIMETLDYDQLIFEFPDASGDASWIHVSHTTHRKNRKQALIAVKRHGKTVYLPFAENKKLLFFEK